MLAFCLFRKLTAWLGRQQIIIYKFRWTSKEVIQYGLHPAEKDLTCGILTCPRHHPDWPHQPEKEVAGEIHWTWTPLLQRFPPLDLAQGLCTVLYRSGVFCQGRGGPTTQSFPLAGCEPWQEAASVQWKGYIFQIYISPRGYVQPEEMPSCKLDKCVCWALGKWWPSPTTLLMHIVVGRKMVPKDVHALVSGLSEWHL